MFGMGVDPDTDKFGNSPSGVALKFLYSLLDLKCDVLERKMKTSLREFLWFITDYINRMQSKNI
jgi:SPP1 family phage portal protein